MLVTYLGPLERCEIYWPEHIEFERDQPKEVSRQVAEALRGLGVFDVREIRRKKADDEE